jgi:hypothetical protein
VNVVPADIHVALVITDVISVRINFERCTCSYMYMYNVYMRSHMQTDSHTNYNNNIIIMIVSIKHTIKVYTARDSKRDLINNGTFEASAKSIN